jgi:hypothetical protein
VPAEQVPAETKPVAQSWRGPQDGPPSWLRPVPPVDSKDRPPATPVIAKSGAESEAQRQRVAADRSVEFRIMNERPVFRGMPEPSLGNMLGTQRTARKTRAEFTAARVINHKLECAV